jgi:hypothetical protein
VTTEDIVARFFGNLADRVRGPLSFRLILQPAVGIFLATRDGMKDARAGRVVYGWSIFFHRAARPELIRQGWASIAKVFIAAVIIDCIYQIIVERWIYVGEALVVAAILAVVPYLFIRGPINRLARRFYKPQSR